MGASPSHFVHAFVRSFFHDITQTPHNASKPSHSSSNERKVFPPSPSKCVSIEEYGPPSHPRKHPPSEDPPNGRNGSLVKNPRIHNSFGRERRLSKVLSTLHFPFFEYPLTSTPTKTIVITGYIPARALHPSLSIPVIPIPNGLPYKFPVSVANLYLLPARNSPRV